MGEELSRHAYGTPSETFLHPVVIISVLIAAGAIFLFRSKYLLIPLIVVSIFVPLSQKVVISGLDFMILRIMILISWMKILLGKERHFIKLNTIDKMIILWVLSNIVCFTLLWQTSGAFVNRLGFAYNVFGIYFLFRFLIQDISDIERIIKSLAVMSIFVAICMLLEQENGRNIFSVFGGVPENTPIRGGRLRSQGAFAHPILAGMFGATLMPLFVSLWHSGRNRLISILGSISATVVIITSSSSGPVIAYFAGIAGLFSWFLKKYIRQVWWGVIFSVITLHIVMKAPVWALIARADVIGGSTAYHRYYLVDQFIKRVDEWWLFGTKSTEHWGWMMWDHANQYVSVGTAGGLLALVLFLTLIGYSFRIVGRKVKSIEMNSSMQFQFWACGAALLTHVVGFMGVAYFDQMILIWYMLLAIIASLHSLPVKSLALESSS